MWLICRVAHGVALITHASAYVSCILSVAILRVLEKWIGKFFAPFQTMFDYSSGQGSFIDDSEMYILAKIQVFR